MEQHQYPRLKAWASILIGSFVMMFYAFHNGFPLMYPDSGAYIYMGMEFEMPWDRSLVYGWFVRHISLNETLWLPVFVQGWMVSLGVYQILKHFTSLKNSYLPIYHLGILMGLTVLTSASAFTSFIMPDIFTPIAFICWILLLFAPSLNVGERIGLSLIFVLSHATHNSHLLIGLSLLLAVGFYYVVWGRKTQLIPLKRILWGLGLMAAVWLSVPSLHYLASDKFALSEASTPFTLTHLLEIGVLEAYLDDTCRGDEPYKICPYKDRIPPSLLWDLERSPAYLTGGWEANEEEYQTIIREIFTTPKYLKVYLYKSLSFGIRQFFTFDTGDAPVSKKGSSPYGNVEKYFNEELREYSYALQQGRNYSLRWDKLNNRIQITMWVSFALLIVALFHPKISGYISPRTRGILLFLLLALLINAVICSTFSQVVPRYQSRVAWLLPMLLMVPFLEWIGQKEKWREWWGVEKS
ncbi:MAG: hypothetical protein AAFP89_24755 [Bacteroidota bacterium]